LETAKTLHTTLLGLIQSGLVKSAHDCSEGGLAVALAESCISQLIARETPRLIGATIDLSRGSKTSASTPCSSAKRNRAWSSCKPLDAVKVVERAKLMGVPAVQIGKVGGDKLTVKTAAANFRPAGRPARCVVERHRPRDGVTELRILNWEKSIRPSTPVLFYILPQNYHTPEHSIRLEFQARALCGRNLVIFFCDA
jgi:hypothetical protein